MTIGNGNQPKGTRPRLPARDTATNQWHFVYRAIDGKGLHYEYGGACTPTEDGELWWHYKPDMSHVEFRTPVDFKDLKVYEGLAVHLVAPAVKQPVAEPGTAAAFHHGQLIEAHAQHADPQTAQSMADAAVACQLGALNAGDKGDLPTH